MHKNAQTSAIPPAMDGAEAQFHSNSADDIAAICHEREIDFLRKSDTIILEERNVDGTSRMDTGHADAILDAIGTAVISTDMLGNIQYMNRAAEKITGWSNVEAQSNPIGHVLKIVSGPNRAKDFNPAEMVERQDSLEESTSRAVMSNRNRIESVIEYSISRIQDSGNRTVGTVTVFQDVTAMRAMVMQLAHLAQHDFLTKLPNRLLLNDRIAQAINMANRHGRTFAVLYLDLDNFKHINDSLGHGIGDKLLQSVALRLSNCVRASDTVSRQGGDEFVMIVSEKNAVDDAALTADKILCSMALPHTIEEHELHVTTSIGISIYPMDAHNADELIRNADIAMYQAKKMGRNNYQFFTGEANSRAGEQNFAVGNLPDSSGTQLSEAE